MKALHEMDYWEWLDTIDQALQERFYPLAEDWAGDVLPGGFSTSSEVDDATVTQTGPDSWIVTHRGVTRKGSTLTACFEKIDATFQNSAACSAACT